jgi:hypothetical protein
MKYTETDQSAKTERNDVALKKREVRAGDRRHRIRHEIALPPSKPRAGSRLMKANNSDAAMNKRVSKEREIIVTRRAEHTFARGPESASIASLT